MIASVADWNSEMKLLKIRLGESSKKADELIRILLDLHAWTHESAVSAASAATRADELWQKQRGDNFRRCTPKNIYSVAWHLWHCARIEDITSNHYIARDEEVFYSGGFSKKLAVPFCHTGNSMTAADMEVFNSLVSLEQLRVYRNAVGKKTRQIISGLDPKILSEKVSAEAPVRIKEKGSVAAEDSFLLDFWGKKRISGIVTMPLTRHLLVHLNSALRLV
jgi:hypothetical protein